MATSLDESTNNIGAIVGAVVVVLLVIIVVVVAFVFIRKRKHLKFCRSCITLKDKKPKETFQMNASHNVAYSLEDDNQNYEGEPSRGGSNQNGVLRSSEPTTSHDHTKPEYANVMNPQTRKIKPPASNKEEMKNSANDYENHSSDHEKSDRSVYELADNSAFCQDQADTSYVNIPSCNQEDAEGTDYTTMPEPAPNPTDTDQQGHAAIYHILEKDHGAAEEDTQDADEKREAGQAEGQALVYNSLNFDRDHGDSVESRNAARAVYNHMNGGDEATYNEVLRDQRVEVIDGEYSRLK